MKTIGNILWLILSGIEMAIAYAIAGLIAFVLIVTIPFGVQAFKLAGFALWPFGRGLVEVEDRSAASTVGNVLWFVLAGWWLALLHVVLAIGLVLTIIGIPFAVANLKLAGAALFPFGRSVVDLEEARRRGGVVVERPGERA